MYGNQTERGQIEGRQIEDGQIEGGQIERKRQSLVNGEGNNSDAETNAFGTRFEGARTQPISFEPLQSNPSSRLTSSSVRTRIKGVHDDTASRLSQLEGRVEEQSRQISYLSSVGQKQDKSAPSVHFEAGFEDGDEENSYNFRDLKDHILVLSRKVDAAYANYSTTNDANSEGKEEAKKTYEALLTERDKLVTLYLQHQMTDTVGTDNVGSRNLLERMQALHTQLNEVTRKNLTKPQAPVSRWSLSAWYTTDKNAQALRSVQRLAKDKAFASPSSKSDSVLKVNADILDLMAMATYALTMFNLNHGEPASQVPPSVRSAPAALSTPPRMLSSSAVQSMTPQEKIVEESNDLNRIILTTIRTKLDEVQKRADGLIGTQNATKQFWGKVLMTVALAIAATVAAVTIMSLLGFALPTFLAPYVAYIQASQLVVAALNFVSATLAVELTTAAAVTVSAGAAVVGMFGKALHHSGAPTSLKSSLDRAAKDLDTAIASTPAMTAKASL